MALQCLILWWQRSTPSCASTAPESTLDVMNFPEEETNVLSFVLLSAEVFFTSCSYLSFSPSHCKSCRAQILETITCKNVENISWLKPRNFSPFVPSSTVQPVLNLDSMFLSFFLSSACGRPGIRDTQWGLGSLPRMWLPTFHLLQSESAVALIIYVSRL